MVSYIFQCFVYIFLQFPIKPGISYQPFLGPPAGMLDLQGKDQHPYSSCCDPSPKHISAQC